LTDGAAIAAMLTRITTSQRAPAKRAVVSGESFEIVDIGTGKVTHHTNNLVFSFGRRHFPNRRRI